MKNRIIDIRKLLLIMIWTFMVSWVQGQPSLAFYPLDDHFNSYDYNPAFLTSPERFTFSMFPLAGMNASTNNQEVIRYMSSQFFSGSITQQDYDKIFEVLLNKSVFHENIDGTFLNFTYKSKAGFFNFRIKDRQFIGASMEGELNDFIFRSDIRSVPIGQWQSLPIQAAHYREYSLGYSHTSRDKRFIAGIRGKLYFGKFAFYSDFEASIQNRLNDYGLVSQGLINISFPSNTITSPNDTTNTVDFSKKSILNYFWNSGNTGMGVDLGIHYKMSPSLSLSFSVIDLGRINWKENLNSRDMDKIFLLYNYSYGIDTLAGVPTITKRENYTYSDTFDFFDLERDSSSFKKALPTTLYWGLKYHFSPEFSVSVTDRFVWMKNLNFNSLALAATVDINNKFSLSSGYSIIGKSYFNIPFALLFKRDFGQIYCGTDNITSLVNAAKTEFASISFGACFYLFTQRNLLLKRSEQLPFYQPRKTIKNRGSGLLIKPHPKD